MKPVKMLIIVVFTAVIIVFSSCSGSSAESEKPVEIAGLTFSESVPLAYAEQFTIDRYEGGYSLIRTMKGERYLLVPREKEVPAELSEEITVIQKPIDNIYLVAATAMGHFVELGQGEAVKFSGKKAEDWYIDYARNAVENGTMKYAGKYREPDYEMLMENGCRLSIQSTMIEHSPEVKEKLNELGIPVFIDYSSYESHPLGRSEWIKLYGEMTDTSDLAEKLFNEQVEELQSISETATGKIVAFFYINTAGQAVTRKPGDYISKMIELAGGKNAFISLGDDSSASSITMEWEQFYTLAKNADYIIYNSTIDGEISTIDELVSKDKLLSEFKAVKNGNVWCTKAALYQEPGKLGTVISDLNSIFTDSYETEPPLFLFKLNEGENSD